jgi:carbon-monoxide dehydrogenase medium subunit
VKAARFDYHRARDLDDAVATLAANAEAKVLAGGQSLGPMLNLRLARPSLLVDVGRIEALRSVADDGDAVRIGAAVTHAAIEDGCVAAPGGDILAAVAGRIAYRAIRNRGTIGGSLAHADPAADWLTVLAALDAEVLMVSPRGRRRAPVAGFMLGPFTTPLAADELIEAVRLPKPSPLARWGYCKLWRKTGEFAEALAAAFVDPARGLARVVMGATEGPPTILDGLGAGLAAGGPIADAAEIAEAVKRALPDGGIYEHRVHAAAVRRAIGQASAA